jgi:fatty-acid peroxygenase
MQEIPRDDALDSSLALKAEGYDFIGNRCRRFGVDIFEARLLGKRFYCVSGADAAHMFYAPGRFTRQGALPASVLHLLQDEGSVATLDDAAHRRRKAMFLSLMTPPRLDEIARHVAAELRRCARRWQNEGEVRLHDGLCEVLCRAVCAWAGVPLESDEDARRMTRDLVAMIDNAGSVGPANWSARLQRWRPEHDLGALMDGIRAGEATPPEDSAAYVIAWHRDDRGELLSRDIAAVELINVLRPTVAVARYGTFAALALHEHPESRARLNANDEYIEAFVQGCGGSRRSSRPWPASPVATSPGAASPSMPATVSCSISTAPTATAGNGTSLTPSAPSASSAGRAMPTPSSRRAAASTMRDTAAPANGSPSPS